MENIHTDRECRTLSQTEKFDERSCLKIRFRKSRSMRQFYKTGISRTYDTVNAGKIKVRK